MDREGGGVEDGMRGAMGSFSALARDKEEMERARKESFWPRQRLLIQQAQCFIMVGCVGLQMHESCKERCCCTCSVCVVSRQTSSAAACSEAALLLQ
jgi:hypothetical protein